MGFLSVWAMLRSGPTTDTLALAGAVLVIALGLQVGAGLRRIQKVDVLAWAWLIAATISTVIAFFQYFGRSDWLAPLASHAAIGEAYANLRQRNQFASLTVIGLASLLWISRRRGAGQPWVHLLAVALVLGNVAAGSRTGLVTLVMLALMAWAWQGRQVQVVLTSLIAYAIGALLLPKVLEIVTGVQSPGLWHRVAGTDHCSSRMVLWSNVLELISQRPWLGWGWGELDYAHFVAAYSGDRFCDILDNAHNLPLHLAVELGVIAAVLMVVAVAAFVVRQRPWRETDGDRQLAWGVLMVLGLHSLLEYPLWYGPFQIALGLALGILATPVAPSGRSFVVRIFAGAFALALAFAAWDYQRVSQIYLAPEARLPHYREDTLDHVRRSRLFASQAAFAELTLSPLARDNAAWNYAQARILLHYSPEPRVIERAIESATFLGRDDEALWYLVRYRAAFPQAHADWARAVRTQVPQGAR